MMQNTKRIRLVALDLDRTTLNLAGHLSENNRKALEQLMAAGIHVVVASGRAFATLPEDIFALPGLKYVVTSNGSAVYDMQEKVCCQQYILEETVIPRILELTEGEPVTFEAFIDGTAYGHQDYIDHPEKYHATERAWEYVRRTRIPVQDIRGFLLEHCRELESMDVVVTGREMRDRVWEKLRVLENDVLITSSIDSLVEIADRGAGKWNSILYVAEKLGIAPEEILCFGDGDNDADMLEKAGIGIAVANASEACLQAADYVTRHHDEDGVYYALKEILQLIN